MNAAADGGPGGNPGCGGDGGDGGDGGWALALATSSGGAEAQTDILHNTTLGSSRSDSTAIGAFAGFNGCSGFGGAPCFSSGSKGTDGTLGETRAVRKTGPTPVVVANNVFDQGSSSPSMPALESATGPDHNCFHRFSGASTDPKFVDADGAADVPGTLDDDLKLLPGLSPCIDAGDNAVTIAAGFSLDLDGKPRFGDDPTRVDTGLGTPPIVDRGAYECVRTPLPAVPALETTGVLILVSALAGAGMRRLRRAAEHGSHAASPVLRRPRYFDGGWIMARCGVLSGPEGEIVEIAAEGQTSPAHVHPDHHPSRP